MLVLTRRVGEEIVIAGDIRVMVLAVNGRTIRLGVTAPISVHVVRRELLAECPEGIGSPTAGGNDGSREGRGTHRPNRRQERAPDPGTRPADAGDVGPA
jgi:carbon storage regulator